MTGHPWSEKRLHGRCIFAWQGDDGICVSSSEREKRGKRRLNLVEFFQLPLICAQVMSREWYMPS